MSEREKIIETIARVDCDTGHIQGFLYGDHHVIRDVSKRPGEQEIFRASIADCSNEHFAAEYELARRRVETQAVIAALTAAGYAIVKRDAIKEIAVRIERQAMALAGYAVSESPRKLPDIPTATEVSLTHFVDMAGELRFISAQEGT